MKNISIRNRKAFFEYEMLSFMNAGIVLVGSEVKSIRNGSVSFTDSYCYFNNDELYIKNLHISEYKQAAQFNHDPKRDRKLLLNKKELIILKKSLEEKGKTIVPTKIYINEKGLIKVGIAIARGKRQFEKRDSIKKRDAQKEIDSNGI
jgi:SsrA-binding protein